MHFQEFMFLHYILCTFFADFFGNREQRRPLLSSATLGPPIYNSAPSTSRTLVAPIGPGGGVVTVINVPVGLDQPFGTSSSSSSFGIGEISIDHHHDSFLNDRDDDDFWNDNDDGFWR